MNFVYWNIIEILVVYFTLISPATSQSTELVYYQPLSGQIASGTTCRARLRWIT
jgi:hypothetical protein